MLNLSFNCPELRFGLLQRHQSFCKGWCWCQNPGHFVWDEIRGIKVVKTQFSKVPLRAHLVCPDQSRQACTQSCICQPFAHPVMMLLSWKTLDLPAGVCPDSQNNTHMWLWPGASQSSNCSWHMRILLSTPLMPTERFRQIHSYPSTPHLPVSYLISINEAAHGHH